MAKNSAVVEVGEARVSRAEAWGLLKDLLEVLEEPDLRALFELVLQSDDDILERETERVTNRLPEAERAKSILASFESSFADDKLGETERRLFNALPAEKQKIYTVGMGCGYPLALPEIGVEELDPGDGSRKPGTFCCRECGRTWQPARIPYIGSYVAYWWRCPAGCNADRLAGC